MNEPTPTKDTPLQSFVVGSLCGLLIACAAIGIGYGEGAQLTTTPAKIGLGSTIGCGASGLIGNVLWRFHQTGLRTVMFAVPTAIPAHVGVGWALGESIFGSAILGVAMGVLYSLVFGGPTTSR